jgi:hypothetical protein
LPAILSLLIFIYLILPPVLNRRIKVKSVLMRIVPWFYTQRNGITKEADMDLISTLTQNLGVNDTQAKGGAGLIFKLAKEKLPAADFNQVATAIPGVDSIMGAAPAPGGGGLGGLGNLVSGLGGAAGGLGSLAGLAGGFSKLGLSPDMVSKFLPVILNFVQSKGGEGLKAILAKAFR